MYANHSRVLPVLPSGPRVGWMLALSATLLLSTFTPRANAQRTGPRDSRSIIGTAPLDPNVQAQIAALEKEKESRTPLQRKISSQLLYALKMAQHQPIAPGVATLATTVSVDKRGLTPVDIEAHVTVVLLKQIVHNGVLVNDFPRLNAIRAYVPLTLIPTLAASPDVKSIRPADRYHLLGRKIAASPAWQAKHAPLFPSPLPFAFAPPAFLPPALREQRLRSALPGLVTRAQQVRSYVAATGWLASNLSSRYGAWPAALSSNREMLSGLPTLASAFRTNNIGSVTSEGDVTHRADFARSVFQVDGTGIKIGVLSDGVASLATSQSTGDLGPVTVLPGQAGPSNGDEGTAMLEIVHDLAPGAALYFATADLGDASFATNIRNLRAAGCDIIVDDVGYFDESPFQDGPIAQAVNDVTADGALYFSAAGNSGNKDDGTAATWEGDFADGGAVTNQESSSGVGAHLHNFGTATYNIATVPPNPFAPPPAVALFWSDPLGGSSNDYDLYVLNAAGTSLRSVSNDAQNGTQDPYEIASITTGQQRIVVVKRSAAAARFLHLNLFADDGTLSISTTGSISGHPAAVNAFAVAATPAVGPYPNPFNAGNVVETFSSDGPRHVFYNADGTAITPGNFLAAGGAIRNKPDVTAADGVSTSLNNVDFNPFYGTSAAAPHAAAIAGLLRSYNPALTFAQIKTSLEGSAIDIMAAGYDRDSGFGIIDAASALNSVPVGQLTSVTLASGSVTGGTTVQGTVTLHDPAPGGGASVALSALPSGLVSVPATVTVPAGQTSANFSVTTTAVLADATVNIVAKYKGVSRFTTLNISAEYLISGSVTTQDGIGVSGVTITAIGTGVATLPTQTATVNVPIPDGSGVNGPIPGALVSAPLTISGSGTVVSVQVGVNITHQYRGDLQLKLVHPDGTAVLLKNYDYADGGQDVITSYPDQTPSVGDLSVLMGKPVAGTWHLTAQDFFAGDTGTINSFSLTLTANGQPITLTTTTGSTGAYSFANQRSAKLTLTPGKAGFDFIPHSRSVTIGPNQTSQNFTLSQAGIRVTAKAVNVGGAYQITVTCANNASVSATNTQITRAILGASAAPTSPALPFTLGTIPSGGVGSLVLRYPLSAGASGSKVLLRLSGTSSLGSFGGSLQVTLP